MSGVVEWTSMVRSRSGLSRLMSRPDEEAALSVCVWFLLWRRVCWRSGRDAAMALRVSGISAEKCTCMLSPLISTVMSTVPRSSGWSMRCARNTPSLFCMRGSTTRMSCSEGDSAVWLGRAAGKLLLFWTGEVAVVPGEKGAATREGVPKADVVPWVG